MSDGSATIHTVNAQVLQLELEIAKIEHELLKLKPKVVTSQRLTEMRTAMGANAGFRISHNELADLILVATKVLYMVQRLEKEEE